MTKRPYVICHVISSLDGRISGSAFELEETIGAMDEHWKIRAAFGCDAVLNGATTAAEIYADGFLGCEDPARGDVGRKESGVATDSPPREDHIAETDLDNYVVCVDPEGTLKWSRNFVDRPVQPKSHVIEVLTETSGDDYLEYLRYLGISYIFAGRDSLDIDILLAKLADSFGIERVLVTGGGEIDWSMLEAGALDEVSVIITPTISGERDVATMFDRTSLAFAKEQSAVPLELLEMRKLDNGSIHLRYRVGNCRDC